MGAKRPRLKHANQLNFEHNLSIMIRPMTLQTILIDLDNRGVATVSLNRPDVRNALNPLLIAELTNTITKLGQSDEVRVIVLKGRKNILRRS